MSASAARKRTEPRSVYITTEVEIDPYDLEQEGWVYVGDGSSPKDMTTKVEALTGVVHRWHDDNHPGLFQWCAERPCVDVREAARR